MTALKDAVFIWIMAPVEGALRTPKEIIEPVFVEPDSFIEIDDLKPAKIKVFCDGRDNKGSVIIGDPVKIWAFRRNSTEDRFEPLNVSKPIEFSGTQEVQIVSELFDEHVVLTHVKDNSNDTPKEKEEKELFAPVPNRDRQKVAVVAK